MDRIPTREEGDIILLDLRTSPLPKADTGELYRALIDLSNHEPELLTAIAFDGFVLELRGQQANRQKVLASLESRLSGRLYQLLEAALPKEEALAKV